tara:strand:+ start:1140 stop:1493 length:354 start_codon:yes stop_codon:yes gene_type:complete
MSVSAVKFVNLVTGIIIVLSIFVVVFAIAEPIMRSEDEQAKVDIQAEQDRAARIQTFEDSVFEQSFNVVSNIYYVQDSRVDNLCFAVRSVYREGYLSVVDCAKIPASMLHITKTTEE